MDDESVNVTTLPPVNDPAGTLTTILGGLCNKAKVVKSTICSALAKTSFSDVTTAQLVGKGNNKVTKEYLADNLITIVKLIECIAPIVNADPPTLCISAGPPKSNTDFEQ